VARLTRRGFLVVGATGAAGAVLGVGYLAGRTPEAEFASGTGSASLPTSTTVAGRQGAGAQAPAGSRWSDPDSWSDGVPGPGQVAVVTKPIVLDRDVQVGGVVIEPSGQLSFDPATSHRLESAGNVVVQGRLAMQPASPEVEHRLVLTGAREASFAGGGMEVLRSDVGLWVMDKGVLNIAGAPKLAWTRVTGAVPAGATTITLRDDPKGWRPGDDIVLTPTLSPTVEDHSEAFDRARVRSISGRTVTLERPVRFEHPSVDVGADVGPGRVQTAEVLNLTRNVGIEGTPEGRAHVFINSSGKQSVRAVTIRHMGPRQLDRSSDQDGATTSVKGRYGLHFHMCDNGSRGSVVEGVVVRDAGGHSFVAHESHGVTFKDCVAFDVMDEAYWWDGPPGTVTDGATDPGTSTDDTVYDRCVAALVRADPPNEGYGLAGFALGRGSRNICRNCVAVGVQGNVNASGFQWGENQEGPGIWDFHDNVAHNNARHGIFWWQVTTRHHTVFDFVGYRNGGSGILNGSYGDNNHFERCVLVENAETQFFGWAESGPHGPGEATGGPKQSSPQHLVDSVMDSRGLTDFACILAGRAVVESVSVGHVAGNVFKGARKACVAISFDFHDFGPYQTRWKLEGNQYEGNQYWFDGSAHEGTGVETEFGTLRRSDQPDGALKASWNAKVS
jgi:G8 domain